MQAVVIYESMFGATKAVADAVAGGIASDNGPPVVRAADATPEDLRGVDLVVVGAPTHAHGLPRFVTRRGTRDMAAKSHGDLVLQPGADTSAGVREWLSGLGSLPVPAAAFDTRVNGIAFFTGRASKRIARSLRKHGAHLLAGPESFLIAKNDLAPGELDRARAWGARLAGRYRRESH
jgi:hypothetical protein